MKVNLPFGEVLILFRQKKRRELEFGICCEPKGLQQHHNPLNASFIHKPPKAHLFWRFLFLKNSQKVSLIKPRKTERIHMDGDRIALVLVRVTELRSKVTNCTQRDSKAAGSEDDEEEAESLLNIRDALESLESQLSSLQAIQEQQLYEKETALTAIRFGQRKLLEKLKEYKGEHLEVILEAIAFAGETVEDNNDLLLPPYPSRPSRDYLSEFPYAHKITPNGVVTGGSKNENGKCGHESLRDETSPDPRKPLSRLKTIVGAVAKAAITVVGVISVLTLAGYEPRLRKRDNHLNIFSSFQQEEKGEGEISVVECPPGKVPTVAEYGEIRCLVKERVEIPFETTVVATPDIKYGCG